jgi:hypothetical protein
VDGDPHRLRPDHHPTPFSAAEIRDNSRPGRLVRSLVVRAGAEPYVRVMRVVSSDADRVEHEFWTETPDGRPLTEPERGHSAFLDLQGHASMAVDATTIDEETIDIPAGRYECLRYTRVDGDTVDTFWFGKSSPGAPIRFEKRVDGELVFSSTAIEDHRPPAGE